MKLENNSFEYKEIRLGYIINHYLRRNLNFEITFDRIKDLGNIRKNISSIKGDDDVSMKEIFFMISYFKLNCIIITAETLNYSISIIDENSSLRIIFTRACSH